MPVTTWRDSLYRVLLVISEVILIEFGNVLSHFQQCDVDVIHRSAPRRQGKTIGEGRKAKRTEENICSGAPEFVAGPFHLYF